MKVARKTISSGSPYEDKVGYSRAVICDGWVFVAGTTGVDQATGEIPQGVTTQCELALQIIDDALGQAGCDFSDVVRVHYMLPDRAEFEACWPMLQAAFGKSKPAATMIECGLLDPRMRIEIEVTARMPIP